ncbi:MAG: acyl carrier protein [Acidobacteria bacterium]|nr:MAG: acyl carrier protein [Acidobacteriota bacterium]
MTHSADPLTAVQEQVQSIILTEASAKPTRLELDTPLFETLLDSTSVLTLTSALEQHFGVAIEDRELVPANFSTLRHVAAFIERKLVKAVVGGGW